MRKGVKRFQVESEQVQTFILQALSFFHPRLHLGFLSYLFFLRHFLPLFSARTELKKTLGDDHTTSTSVINKKWRSLHISKSKSTINWDDHSINKSNLKSEIESLIFGTMDAREWQRQVRGARWKSSRLPYLVWLTCMVIILWSLLARSSHPSGTSIDRPVELLLIPWIWRMHSCKSKFWRQHVCVCLANHTKDGNMNPLKKRVASSTNSLSLFQM